MICKSSRTQPNWTQREKGGGEMQNIQEGHEAFGVVSAQEGTDTRRKKEASGQPETLKKPARGQQAEGCSLKESPTPGSSSLPRGGTCPPQAHRGIGNGDFYVCGDYKPWYKRGVWHAGGKRLPLLITGPAGKRNQVSTDG